jgi:RNA polymerase sigma-70 factor, ECF subfamily
MSLDEATIIQTLMAERARLLAYIWSIVHDAHLVEDVFQEVSLLAVGKRMELRDKQTLAVWLRRSARLISIAAMRRKGRLPLLFREEVLDKLDASWTNGNVTTTEETFDLLHRCMAELSSRSREFITLRYVNRFSGTELAEKLGMTVASVYASLARIHRNLRECIQRHRKLEGTSRG